MKSVWGVVFRKELKETLRDRRTLFIMVAVPILLYPAMLIGTEQLFLLGARNLEAESSPVAVMGDPPQVLLDLVDADSSLSLVPIQGDAGTAIRDEAVAVIAVVGSENGPSETRDVTLLFDAASDRSLRAHSKLRQVVQAWEDSVLADRLRERGLPASFAAPVEVADSSVARASEVGGYTLGRMLPMLLVMMTVLGAFYPAIDLAAGEKERGTLETLLTAPVPSDAIVAGKFVTVALIGVIAAGLNLASILLTFRTGLLQVTDVFGLEVSLPFRAVVIIFLCLVPLAILFGAVFLGLAVRAGSFKEAQNVLTPVYALAIFPAMLPVFPGIDFGPLLALAPVAGVSFLFRDLMIGDASWLLGGLVLASTILYAAIGLIFAARAFGSENVLFGADESPDVPGRPFMERLLETRREGRTPTPRASLGFVAGIAVLFFFLGISMQIAWGELGIVAAEWLLLLTPAVLFVTIGRFDAARTLSLRAPKGTHLLAAFLLIGGALPVIWLIGWLQSFVLPIPWEMLEGLEELMTAQSPQRFLWLLLIVAVTPALCEEIVFRGVLLGGTRSLTPWRMILLNGIIFGAFHLSFETVIRFLPTAMLGCLIAWVVWRTGSIWVGALMHFLNNGTILGLTSIPVIRELLSDPEAPPPVWWIPAGAAVLALGILIVHRTTTPTAEVIDEAT